MVKKTQKLLVVDGPVKIDTSFISSSPEGLAVAYIRTGELPERVAISTAIRCLYAPLGAIQEGKSREEVLALIEASKTTHRAFMDDAINRLGIHLPESQADAEPSPPEEIDQPTSNVCVPTDHSNLFE
jgi:hypothetical protein